MGESVKASRLMLLGAVRRATVTAVDFEAADAVTLDADLAAGAGFLEHEKVDVVGLSNGVRLAAQLRLAPAGSGELALTGAAAYHLKPGDTVDLTSFGWMKGKAAAHHAPHEVRVEADNRRAAKKK